MLPHHPVITSFAFLLTSARQLTPSVGVFEHEHPHAQAILTQTLTATAAVELMSTDPISLSTSRASSLSTSDAALLAARTGPPAIPKSSVMYLTRATLCPPLLINRKSTR